MINAPKFIKYTTYRQILGLLLEKTYITKKEIHKILNANSTKKFEILQNADIITSSKLTEEEKTHLRALDGMNEFNINSMRIYRFTSEGFKAFNKFKKQILSKMASYVKDRLRYYKQRWNEHKEKLRILKFRKESLENMDFRKICPNNGTYIGLKEVGVHNAYDFIQYGGKNIAIDYGFTKSIIEEMYLKISNWN